MALFDWTSRCCTFLEVGGVKMRLFRKNGQKIHFLSEKKIFLNKDQMLGTRGQI